MTDENQGGAILEPEGKKPAQEVGREKRSTLEYHTVEYKRTSSYSNASVRRIIALYISRVMFYFKSDAWFWVFLGHSETFITDTVSFWISEKVFFLFLQRFVEHGKCRHILAGAHSVVVAFLHRWNRFCRKSKKFSSLPSSAKNFPSTSIMMCRNVRFCIGESFGNEIESLK